MSKTNVVFEKIKNINEYGKEYWSARDLMTPLGYVRWENFEVAISRAKESCRSSKQDIEDHFRDVTKMIKIATGTEKEALRLVRKCEKLSMNWAGQCPKICQRLTM